MSITTSFTVSNATELNNAIRSIDEGGSNTATGTAYVINVTATISLASDLVALNLAPGSSVVIAGSNGAGASALQTIDGNGLWRGFFAYAGSVTLRDLTIANARAIGGAGGAGVEAGAGGGGAGLGGGLFVAQGATVTLSGVGFSGNSATGGAGGAKVSSSVSQGAGGGGGLGGPGGATGPNTQGGGGGGIGASANGQSGPGGSGAGPGIIPGVTGGGGGGDTGGAGGLSAGGGGGGGIGGNGSGSGGGGGGGIGGEAGQIPRGGAGGFGGGGGGSYSGAVGGAGGFGGGGGGGFQTSGGNGGGGQGGFGGGQGAATVSTTGAAGGGGLGAGGDIFVQQGGKLLIEGNSFLNAGTVNPGAAGGSGAAGGRAYGSALFIQGNETITLAPQAGQTVTIAGSAYDMTSAQDPSGQTGSGGYLIDGAGTVDLAGLTALRGGLTFLPTAAVTLKIGNASVVNGAFTSTIGGFDPQGQTIDLTGLAYTDAATAAFNGSNELLVTSHGTTYTLQSTTPPSAKPLVAVSDGQGGTAVRLAGVGTAVWTDDQLNAAIQAIGVGGSLAASNTNYVIHIVDDFTFDTDIAAVNLLSGSSVTIAATNGKGGAASYTIDGAGAHRGFIAYAGGLTLQGLTIQNFTAVGGAGGSGAGGGGGGGGAGLGGGLFVASGGYATLIDVTFSGNAAIGGAGGGAINQSGQSGGVGGGGGLGGPGGTHLPGQQAVGGGGGGGIGASANGAGLSGQAAGAGIIPGAPGGGGGGGAAGGGGGSTSTVGAGGGINGGTSAAGKGGSGGFGGGGGGGQITGGIGGFGGGGGAGGTAGRLGGDGGFGGGGGGGFFTGGQGGFGGGNGNSGNLSGAGANTGGGGGLGAGGDIFIQQGGGLIIEGGSVLNGGTVAGGQGGVGSRNIQAATGRAYGDGLFIQGNQSVTLVAQAGRDLAINGVITDMTGSGDASGQAGTGSVVVDGDGRVFLSGDNTFTGGVVIQGGTLSLALAPHGAGSGVITFAANADGVLAVTAGPTPVTNQIVGFSAGDKLLFDNIGYAAGTSSAIISNGTLTYTGTSGTGSLLLGGIPDGTPFVASSSGSGGSYIQLDASLPAPCFAAGTLLRTINGDVRVEDLRIGDIMLTHEGRTTPVVWIGHRAVNCVAHPQPHLVWPVRVRAGAFGRDLPRRDLFLSPDHCLFLHGVLIPVKCLVDGEAVAQLPHATVTYYHVELPLHGVVLAEALPVESYLDYNDRGDFTNGGGALRLFPDFASRPASATLIWEARGFAPYRVTGPEVDAAREDLRRRRKAREGRRATRLARRA